MARDSSGTMTLPAGNPVVSGTAISSSVTNATLSDIASELTDSLSRTGKGPMSAPLELTNGSVGVPSLSFDSDTDTGLYRIGADNLGVAVAGAKVVDVAATGVGVTGTLSATGVASLANGAVGTPALNFTSDPDSGMYRIGANNLGVAVNGAKVLDVSTAGLGVTGAVTTSGNVSLTGSDPASTTGFSDTLTTKNIPKAWGYISADGAGNIAVSAGFNIDSVALLSGAAQVTLATGLFDANYCVIATAGPHSDGTSGKLIANVVISNFTAFVVTLRDGIGDTTYSLATNTGKVHFVVFGAQ